MHKLKIFHPFSFLLLIILLFNACSLLEKSGIVKRKYNKGYYVQGFGINKHGKKHIADSTSLDAYSECPTINKQNQQTLAMIDARTSPYDFNPVSNVKSDKQILTKINPPKVLDSIRIIKKHRKAAKQSDTKNARKILDYVSLIAFILSLIMPILSISLPIVFNFDPLATCIIATLCSWLPTIPTILGFLSLNRINKNPDKYWGKWFALAAIITSSVATILIACLYAALAYFGEGWPLIIISVASILPLIFSFIFLSKSAFSATKKK